ncbi:uncharacterized protein BP01DRAFT_359576 [Aspergillus saccharolyticus JOP 1030-1]|uniref:Uncharacterized protein n=1 Tax=Aspergillus saccharolyticus JOP 1030-1 TaxID=1450539 RepID=A0A318ZCA6_9EURO|nr:hypothetical protein BP01DRAFT_359576 [Aspergillus saccharolyticus JOP 1030-1]PYH42323.1 hypothetical protein BP01DRAFT_359576 [Aspergillus saccharolyticus JOP 1030-1]
MFRVSNPVNLKSFMRLLKYIHVTIRVLRTPQATGKGWSFQDHMCQKCTASPNQYPSRRCVPGHRFPLVMHFGSYRTTCAVTGGSLTERYSYSTSPKLTQRINLLFRWRASGVKLRTKLCAVSVRGSHQWRSILLSRAALFRTPFSIGRSHFAACSITLEIEMLIGLVSRGGWWDQMFQYDFSSKIWSLKGTSMDPVP